VPGITSAQGAASRLGVSLTQRELARRVQYITAHGANGRLPSDIDWRSVADPSTTTVVYMPKRTLAELAASALAQGSPPTRWRSRSPPTRPMRGDLRDDCDLRRAR
jgi:uroporphyrin-III C-methyltransferase/precorrin-2 dehydrogenase/sirohydrochlorin ferrochelatase